MTTLRHRLGLADDASRHEVLQFWRRLHRRLGIPLGATPARVREVWLGPSGLALQLHPDRVTDDRKAEASERFRLAKDAYELLRSTSLHQALAAELAAELAAAEQAERAAAARSEHSAPPSPARPGEDLEHLVRVPLLVALHGGAWSVTVDLGVHGWRTIDCTLPAGTEPGLLIRVPREGGAGDPPGALWLVVEALEHETWQLSGLDVLAPLPVTAADFYGGARVVVATPWDQVTLKLRPCDPRRVRVAGHGVRRGTQRGSLLLSPDVVWPAPGDPDLLSALRRLQP